MLRIGPTDNGMIIVLRKTRYAEKGMYWNRREWSEKFRRDFKTSTICNSLWTAFGSVVIPFVGMTEHDPKEIISDFWKLISNTWNLDKTNKEISYRYP